MNLDQINFTPLEQIQKAWRLAFKQIFNTSKPLHIVLGVIGIIVTLGTILVPGIFIFILMAEIILLSVQVNKVKQRAWQQFAAVNKWPISDGDAYVVPPGLQNIGNSRRTSQVIAAQFSNITCDLLTYEYTVGSGKSSHTYYFTIARIRLAKQFPHIILDSKKRLGVRNIPAGYENLALEGDFDKFFKLYEAKGEEVDVLSIITPDVMQTLLDNDQQQDIEIWGNCLYFIGANDERVPAAMRNLLQSVQKLSSEIIQRANSLDYTPVSPQPAH